MSDERDRGSGIPPSDGGPLPWYLSGAGTGSTAPLVPPTPPAPPPPAGYAAETAPPARSADLTDPSRATATVGAGDEPWLSSAPDGAAQEATQVVTALPRPRTPESPAPSVPLAAPAPPSSGSPSLLGNRRGVLLGALGLVVLLAVGGGAGWLIHNRMTPAASSSSATTTASSAQTTTAAHPSAPASTPAVTTQAQPSPSVSPETAALAQLGALRMQSLQRVVLDGRWVAQVASKSVGITDPLQTAANGSHTFYAVDILAESTAARSRVSDPASVLVLSSTDFGKTSTAADGQPYWVTLVDGGFGSSADVEAWCASTYADLSQAARDDTCVARTLSPPHS